MVFEQQRSHQAHSDAVSQPPARRTVREAGWEGRLDRAVPDRNPVRIGSTRAPETRLGFPACVGAGFQPVFASLPAGR